MTATAATTVRKSFEDQALQVAVPDLCLDSARRHVTVDSSPTSQPVEFFAGEGPFSAHSCAGPAVALQDSSLACAETLAEFAGSGRAASLPAARATSSAEIRFQVRARTQAWARVRLHGSGGGLAGFYLRRTGPEGARTVASQWAGHDAEVPVVVESWVLEPGIYAFKVAAEASADSGKSQASWSAHLTLCAGEI